MWLLNAKTMRLERIVDEKKMYGKYAILSHTWEKEDDEVNFDDIHQLYATSMKGYKKLEYSCIEAVKSGLSYVWADTCCIDKKSSAELSEAINSMFRWYSQAAVCYAYLSDVAITARELVDGDVLAEDNERVRLFRMGTQLRPSRWFSRGWTLQELIAPHSVEFYDSTWTSMGTKAQLVNHLSEITKIPTYVLQDRDRLEQTSIAQRMSWASERSTSRIEDQAYALLGIFGINMPLLYGEGSKAFMRLQEKIISTSSREDHSLLVWPDNEGHLLAPSPRCFVTGDQVVSSLHCLDETFELSKKGLRVTLLARADDTLARDTRSDGDKTIKTDRYAATILVALNCCHGDHVNDQRIALRLHRRPRVHTLGFHQQQYDALGEVIYDRLSEMTIVTSEELRYFTAMTITIARRPYSWPTIPRKISISDDITIASVSEYVPEGWNQDVPKVVGGFYELKTLSASSALGRLAVKGTQASWMDVVLSVAIVYTEKSPQLLVHASDNGQHDEMDNLDVLRLCSMIGEGEERVLEVSGRQALRVVARYVFLGGELLWNLEIGRPRCFLGMSPARIPIVSQQELDCPEAVASPATLGSIERGDRPEHSIQVNGSPRSAQLLTLPSRATPAQLPTLNTNLPPHLNNPEMVSAVPASSIDVEQYYQQQQFLAELYLAHIRKQEQASRPDLVEDGRPLRSMLRPSTTIRQTRLVRFMYDRMHRVFRANSAAHTSVELPVDRLTRSQASAVPELGVPDTVYELHSVHRSHELHASHQHVELPATPVIHIPDSREVYELESTPARSTYRHQASSVGTPTISFTAAPESSLPDVAFPLDRRFSWELPTEQPRSTPSALPAQGRSPKLTVDTSVLGFQQSESLSADAGAYDRNVSTTDLAMLAEQHALSMFLEPRTTQKARPVSAST